MSVINGVAWGRPTVRMVVEVAIKQGRMGAVDEVTSTYSCLNCSTVSASYNVTQGEETWDVRFVVLWLQLVGILALTLVTVLGNGLVILTFICTGGHKKATNCLIISLAVVDMLIGILFPVSTTAYILQRWPLGELGCKVFLATSHILLEVAMLCTLLITLDRWWSINKPFMYRVWQSRHKAVAIIGSAWGVGCLVYVPPFIFWPTWEKEAFRECVPPFKENMSFSVAVGFTEFLIPTLVVVCCNVSIYRRVRGRQNSGVRRSMTTQEYLSFSSTSLATEDVLPPGAKIRTSRRTSLAIPTHTDCVSDYLASRRTPVHVARQLLVRKNGQSELQHCDNNHSCPGPAEERRPLAARGRRVSFDVSMIAEQARKQRRQSPSLLAGVHRTSELMVKEMLNRQNRKAARSLILLVSTFLVCWCPYALIKMIGPMLGSEGLPFIVYRGSEWLCYFNSSVNPILQVIGNAQVGKRLRYILGLRTRRRSDLNFEALGKLPVMIPCSESVQLRKIHQRGSRGSDVLEDNSL